MIAALVLVCAWLGILTLVVMLLVRQVGLLTVRFSTATAVSLDDDGLEVGSSLPEDVAEVMPEEDQAYILLVSAGCDPCRSLVGEIHGQHFEQNIVALVPGRQEQADELTALLPPTIRTVLDPEATQLTESLELDSAPFVMEVQGGTLTRKFHLYGGASALTEFLEAGSDPSEKGSFVEITEKHTIDGR